MVTIHFYKALILLALYLIPKSHLSGQSQTNERASWFVEARFGMFIHWGVYSGAEGIWKGEKLRYDNNYAEWIQYRNQIEQKEYLSLLERFDWDKIDPEEWVLLAKKAGMKYVTITAKHHDGFALWDSKVSDFDIADHTDPKRDIIKELSEGCKKHGLKLGLYYSHWVDWEHRFGWDHTKEITGITPEEYDQYWQEKVIPQMRELLTNYGDIGIIWFDMWIHHSRTIVTKEQLLQLKSMIRELQPNCLVNSRLGLSIEEDNDVDIQTLGDNQLGSMKRDHPWQTAATVAHSWGFHALDTEWKSTTTLLRSLINNASLNGNFMLNIGPRANGEVPFEITQRLEEMGEWLAVNGASIYGSEAFDLRKNLHDWGQITYKDSYEGKHTLYLHVFNWPLYKQVCLTGITSSPSKIYMLKDKQESPLFYEHNEVITKIDLPELQVDSHVSVVVVEYDQKPEIKEDLVAISITEGYSLTTSNMFQIHGDTEHKPAQRFGSIPEHDVIDGKCRYQWKVFIDAPCKMAVDVSYSYQGDSESAKITLEVADSSLHHTIQLTGKTVGEPGQNWAIDRFKSTRLGEITIPGKGYYEIMLEISTRKNDPVQFQWIWLQKL